MAALASLPQPRRHQSRLAYSGCRQLLDVGYGTDIVTDEITANLASVTGFATQLTHSKPE